MRADVLAHAVGGGLNRGAGHGTPGECEHTDMSGADRTGDARLRRRPGLQALLRLFLAATLALYGLAPAVVVVPDRGEPLVAWTLPGGEALPICHGIPGDPAGEGNSAALHCLKCLVLGHAVAHALPVAATPVVTVVAGRADWPAPAPILATAFTRHGQGARAPPLPA